LQLNKYLNGDKKTAQPLPSPKIQQWRLLRHAAAEYSTGDGISFIFEL